VKVLLDTCAILWCVSDPSRLGPQSREILSRSNTVIYYSAISAAEIACLSGRGRITLDRHWRLWFTYFTELNGWGALDISLDVLFEAYSLPEQFHQDPADRIIVATARCHDLVIVTADQRIIDYPHVATVF
jgi:PIN domain nuclease of toxin-antitoxin system